MPRPPRIIEPGGIYHVMSRGNRRQGIYTVDDDNRCFLRLLGLVIRKRRWQIWAYCLMPNHFHLVVAAPQGDLSAGIQWLNGVYAQWFNETHGYDGHLFQGRFRAKRMTTDRHLLEGIRYVVLNPVRARICSYPGAWPWSSYQATAGTGRAPAFFDPEPVLSLFGGPPSEHRRAWRAFVADGRLEPNEA